jgi:hypothetical protein
MNEEELNDALASGTPEVREYYRKAYRFSRFFSLNPLAIFVLGGAFMYFTERAAAQWRYYATLDMNFLAWVLFAAFALLSAIRCYISLGSETARWALNILRRFDPAFVEGRLTRFSRFMD